MQIIAGMARNLELAAPPGSGVRPTLARSRKALFDSLGEFSGRNVLDLFAGSGALGLEAASRGAGRVVLIELDRSHCRVIEENIARVRKTGVEIPIETVNADVLEPCRYAAKAAGTDLILADPPYPVSAEAYRKLLADSAFRAAFSGALLVWELPDLPGAAGAFLEGPELEERRIRRFGSVQFLTGRVPA